MSAPQGFNYAHAYGILSVPAASVFAALYVPLTIYSIWRLISMRRGVLFFLLFFCILRVASFVLRAVLAGTSAGTSLNALIAFEVIFSIGFVGLLFSAYVLVLDRQLASNAPLRQGPIASILRNRHIYRLVLTAGIALSIAGTVLADDDGSHTSVANVLRKIGTAVILILTVILVWQTITFFMAERRVGVSPNASAGARHGTLILSLIALLLLIRECFVTATLNHPTKQANEHFWYPLIVLPEFLVVLLYCVPGLIPDSAAVNQVDGQQKTEYA